MAIARTIGAVLSFACILWALTAFILSSQPQSTISSPPFDSVPISSVGQAVSNTFRPVVETSNALSRKAAVWDLIQNDNGGAGKRNESSAVSTAPNDPLNMLLVFPDSMRFDFDGMHAGIPVRTPHMQWIATQGVRFTHANCPSPQCTPSRAAMVSGREYDFAGVPDNMHSYPLSQPTFYSQLKKAGYTVISVGQDDLTRLNAGSAKHEEGNGKALGFTHWLGSFGKMDTVRIHGHAPWEAYGRYLESKGLWRQHVADYSHRKDEREYFNFDPVVLDDEDFQDNFIGRQALEQLQRMGTSSKTGSDPNRRTAPWFMQVNFAGPHPPLGVTRRMLDSVAGLQFSQMAVNCSILANDTIQWMRRLYAAQIENIDRWVGKYLDLLGQAGELNRTLVCVSSDHGDQMGDHDMLGKESPFRGAVSVPLMCRGPFHKRPGLEIRAPVTTMDLAATFLFYGQALDNFEGKQKKKEGSAGSQHQPQRRATSAMAMTSQSLHPLIEGHTTVPNRRQVLSGFGNFRTITIPKLSDSDNRLEAVYKLMCCKGGCYHPRRKVHFAYRPSLTVLTDATPQLLLFDLLADPYETANIIDSHRNLALRMSEMIRNSTGFDCLH